MKAIQRTPYPSLEVVRLGRAEWRVSEAADAGTLLGFVERQNGGRFEIVWMSDPIRWGYVDSFDAALAAMAEPEQFGDVLQARIPVPDRLARRLRNQHEFGDAAKTRRRGTWIGRSDRPGAA
jgi:hypothetical protein